jgi:DNA-binding response OmpR family regulator
MDTRPKVLLVDDETAITSNLAPFLERAGFDTAIASNGEEALQRIDALRPDLVVLDVLMPRLDGRETLRRLRYRGNWIPVILLTQISGTAERIMALEEGADDYLNKPFEPQELVARIRTVLRRARPGPGLRPLNAATQLISQGVSLDRTARRVRVRGQEVSLTHKAIALLEYLMTHPDELVTREHLLDTIWGWDNPVGTRVVDTRIAELRKVLGDDPLQPSFIETVPGQGYRFIGAVEVMP